MQQAPRKRKRSQHEASPDPSPAKRSQQETLPGSPPPVPGNVQPTQAAATGAGGACPMDKLPKELRQAIYEDVYESATTQYEGKVEIMGPGFVALKSLLGVSRQIRHEMQEVLQERMSRKVGFLATCHSNEDVVEAKSRARSVFSGNTPRSRFVRVWKINYDDGCGGYGPYKPLYQTWSWGRNSLGPYQ